MSYEIYVFKRLCVSFIHLIVSKKGFQHTLTILAAEQAWAVELQREESWPGGAGDS